MRYWHCCITLQKIPDIKTNKFWTCFKPTRMWLCIKYGNELPTITAMFQRSASAILSYVLVICIALFFYCTLHNTIGNHTTPFAVHYKYCKQVATFRKPKKGISYNHVRLLCNNNNGLVSYIIYRLILSGDIEINPEPNLNSLKICNLNVRSLLSGVDTSRSLHDQYTKLDEIIELRV